MIGVFVLSPIGRNWISTVTHWLRAQIFAGIFISKASNFCFVYIIVVEDGKSPRIPPARRHDLLRNESDCHGDYDVFSLA